MIGTSSLAALMFTSAAVALPAAAMGAGGEPTDGRACGAVVACSAAKAGIRIAVQTRLNPIGKQDRRNHDRKAGQTSPGSQPTSERTITPGCPGNDPNQQSRPLDAGCNYLTSHCTSIGADGGWVTWVWQRPLDPPGRWVRVGESCNIPREVVAAQARPVITAAMVQRAFRDLPLTPPSVHVQPEGGVTLVNLPTFYAVRWPDPGYGPDEIADVQLLGARVQIRPRPTGYRYDFGDGEQLGPTTDPGGTWPDGGVQHTYSRNASALSVTVRADYAGQYRLPGGQWRDIGLTVPVDGPVTAIQVKQARGRLYDGPG